MNVVIKICCLVMCLFFTALLHAGEGKKLLDNFLLNTENMRADFVQILRTKDGIELQESSGVFYLKRPGKFRWNYAEPYKQEIISDGESIWVYDVDLDQVTVQKQQGALSNTPMALLENRATLDKSFNIKELDNKNGIYRIQLTSKQPGNDFNNVVLGLAKTGLRYMVLDDQFDQETEITFSGHKINTTIKDELFDFIPPDGVDVFGG